MITHNGKQVTLAMRNRKAINLIARNGKAMFGELEDLRGYGITYAAKAVILAEYGSVVWSDVKQYAKAHPAIVPFINQDPHLAASISTNSNKRRYITNTQGAYIDTGIIPTEHPMLDFETMVAWSGMDKFEECLFASIGNSNAGTGIYGLVFHGTPNSASFMCGVYNQGAATKLAPTIGRTKISGIHNNGGVEVYVNDAYINSGITNALSSKPIWMFIPNGHYWNIVSGYNAVYELEYLKFSENQTPIAEFLPCLYNGQCGMLDLVTYTFHPNANTEGQFTIAITDKE